MSTILFGETLLASNTLTVTYQQPQLGTLASTAGRLHGAGGGYSGGGIGNGEGITNNCGMPTGD